MFYWINSFLWGLRYISIFNQILKTKALLFVHFCVLDFLINNFLPGNMLWIDEWNLYGRCNNVIRRPKRFCFDVDRQERWRCWCSWCRFRGSLLLLSGWSLLLLLLELYWRGCIIFTSTLLRILWNWMDTSTITHIGLIRTRRICASKCFRWDI